MKVTLEYISLGCYPWRLPCIRVRSAKSCPSREPQL